MGGLIKGLFKLRFLNNRGLTLVAKIGDPIFLTGGIYSNPRHTRSAAPGLRCSSW